MIERSATFKGIGPVAVAIAQSGTVTIRGLAKLEGLLVLEVPQAEWLAAALADLARHHAGEVQHGIVRWDPDDPAKKTRQTTCCHLPLHELSRNHRITADPERVTCPFVQR